MTRPCACCGNLFELRPQVPNQSFCSSPDCQRARKRQWHRAKLQSDPDYRVNQRAAQQAWAQRHPGYWHGHRTARPEYEQRNREQQQSRDQARNAGLANVCELPSGLYRITRHPAFPSYTYNNRINHISSIQEHHMLRRAVERGVTPERLAKALNVDISLVHKKMSLLEGICPEAVEMLKDQHFAANLGSVLRKLKPARQVECVELMLTANNMTVAYAGALLAATPPHLLVNEKRPRKIFCRAAQSHDWNDSSRSIARHS